MLLKEKMQSFPFSAGEKNIVNYLLNQKFAISEMTAEQIAQATFSSKSSLVRIAKKLDFSGWIDLKTALLEELDYTRRIDKEVDANHPFGKQDDFLSIASKIAHLEIKAIEDSLSLINQQILKETVNLLYRAQTIHLFAVSNNLHNVQEFAHNMKRIQKDVRVHGLQSEAIFDAYLAKKNSCALVVTYSGETQILLRMMQILRRHQIPIILLTSLGINSASKLADQVLHLATRERLYSKIATFSTDASISYLLDLLYSCIFSKDYESNLALRQQTSRLVERERTSDSEILSEN